MPEVVMRTGELVSNREYNKRLVKILYSIYSNAYFAQIAANSTKMNTEDKTELLSFLKDFEDLFCGTTGYRDTDPVSL